MYNADEEFEKLGLELPPVAKPLGLYKPCVISGNCLYLSGHGPLKLDGTQDPGCVGADLDADGGKAAAQLCGLAMLATIKAYLGSLDRVKRVIKVFGMVNSTPEFTKHPYVINGCSELFAKVWGTDNGVGTRSAVGMSGLPGGVPVEIEAIFELK
jgi:enamine deaminase RidA (YjgF/YER057c/UK114 family)